MLYICEFEFSESNGFIDAVPCNNMGAGTFGGNLEGAVESAADWLKEIVDDALINENELPEITIGHEPTHNGEIIAIAVSRELSDIPSMTAADAARELNVSTSRISQLVNAGLLESWKEGTECLISKASVEARKLIYQVFITKDEDGFYNVEVSDLPGCFTFGDTYEEAVHMAADAMQTYVSSLLVDGENPPKFTHRECPEGVESVNVFF